MARSVRRAVLVFTLLCGSAVADEIAFLTTDLPCWGFAAPPPPYLYYPYRYYGPGRFGFFGPLLGIFLFVFLLRALFWGACGWGWRRRWGYDGYPDYGPSRFDEWHRRAHDRMRDDRAPSTPPTNA